MRINPANSSPIQNADSSAAGSVKKSDKMKTSAYEGKGAESASVSNSESAKTEISSKARDMARAKQLAVESPDIREAKIAELKDKIQNKKYNVSAEAISDRLVDDHLRMAGA